MLLIIQLRMKASLRWVYTCVCTAHKQSDCGVCAPNTGWSTGQVAPQASCLLQQVFPCTPAYPVFQKTELCRPFGETKPYGWVPPLLAHQQGRQLEWTSKPPASLSSLLLNWRAWQVDCRQVRVEGKQRFSGEIGWPPEMADFSNVKILGVFSTSLSGLVVADA